MSNTSAEGGIVIDNVIDKVIDNVIDIGTFDVVAFGVGRLTSSRLTSWLLTYGKVAKYSRDSQSQGAWEPRP